MNPNFSTKVSEFPIFSSIILLNTLFVLSCIQIFTTLPEPATRVAERVGVEESYLARASVHTPPYQSTKKITVIHRRFFLAMVLQDVVAEVPLYRVGRRFGVDRGKLQVQ